MCKILLFCHQCIILLHLHQCSNCSKLMKFLLLLVFDNELCFKKNNILDLRQVLLKFPKYDMLQNSNQSHYKHNVFGNNFICLTYGIDILLEVVHGCPPKSLTYNDMVHLYHSQFALI